ncbi:hypothetical protein [Micromonospora cremea]|uniref:Uncharacterized protein n=1 Tax=Micromonospora cremea TaxID=709881 RepID=A0A1N6BDN6_9ACTN|nr:hypothetical protein [Micromonospora cremea]SIN44460.1 hypothetical protein SAMN04489832_7258 [Micromonospora cremea]
MNREDALNAANAPVDWTADEVDHQPLLQPSRATRDHLGDVVPVPGAWRFGGRPRTLPDGEQPAGHHHHRVQHGHPHAQGSVRVLVAVPGKPRQPASEPRDHRRGVYSLTCLFKG